MFELDPELTLTGYFAELIPLTEAHEAQLVEAASDGELWNLRFTGVPSSKTARAYIKEALVNRDKGAQLPFAVQRRDDGKIVGCTRFYDIDPEHRNLAIGYTWYAKSAQRTAINTQCKLLLLEYAFEAMSCISVAFHTDNLNTRSQAAIERLGAQKEGVLRNHRIMPDGRKRHTHCYSIIESEWPRVRSKLEASLSRTRL